VSFRYNLLAAALGGLAALATMPAMAGPLVVGSGNEAVIEPSVAVPDETPCVVPLLTGAIFGANAVSYSYTPPSACPGPWAKVVLVMAISLNKGVQYDRSGELFMGGIPLWFGTTAEPRATLAPSWTFQKDVTDYTAVFATPQSGFLQIANYQSNIYPSTITATATLKFYPPTASAPAPVTADVVIPLPSGGGIATLNNGSSTFGNTLSLPTNILQATLDLYLQGQSGDEFWYTCVPNSLADELESCGGGALREGEVTVDGTPAGVAPVYPWIFTGGIDPFLWQPIPGVQTFDFTPFHADLSPFAGLLSNGQPHTIAASVYGDNGYFSATGALRLFLDHAASTVTGAVTVNTLAASPTVTTTPNLITSSVGVVTGTLRTSDKRSFTIKGYVVGAAGKTVNTLQQVSTFSNTQSFHIADTKYVQNIVQTTDITITTKSANAGTTTSAIETLHYPLTLDITELFPASGSVTQITSINQQFLDSAVQELNGSPSGQSALSNAIQSTDTLFLTPEYEISGNNAQSETATYLRTGSGLPCFKRVLGSTFNVISSVQTGC
jgi:NAD(P)H-dependent FMN reductase